MPRTDTRPQLRHRIVLAPRTTSTANALGELLSGYDPDTGATVWADVRPLSAGESYRAQRLAQKTTHKITIRWRATPPANNDRIAWTRSSGARWMRVESVRDPDERREWLEIMAEDEGEAVPA